jgi:O-antigen ligase
MALPFLVTLNGVAPRFGDASLRLDQIVATLLVIPLFAGAIAGTRRVRLDRASWWLLALLAVNVAASAINSPVPWYSIRQCLNLGSAWVIYVLLINFLEDLEELEKFLNRVVWAAIAASAIGIIAFALAAMGLHVGGADVTTSAAEYQTSAYGAYGTMVEPNIFGSFTAAQLMLVVALFVAATRESTTISLKLLRWAIALTATGLVLSFTRAAWLGGIAGFVCFWLLSGRMPNVRLRVGGVLAVFAAAGVIVTVLLLVPGDVGTIFRFKIANLFNVASQTAIVRLVSWALALEQTSQHPVMGWGTFTFGALTAQTADFQSFENWRNLWIGNYLLLAVHDTGVIGLALLIGALAIVIKQALRVLKTMSMEDRKHASRVVGLVAALAVFLVSFLATTGFTLGYSWLIVGLLAAYCRVLGERRTVAQ